MRTITESVIINASPETVFGYVDDIRNMGWHMTKASMPLMGSKLNLEVVSANSSGVGATYRWHGKVAGLPIDFTEVVTTWIANGEKVWNTIGNPQLVIMSNYEMRLQVEPVDSKTKLTFEITWDLPKAAFGKFAGWLLGDWYSRWCLKSMSRDTKNALEQANQRP